MTFWITVHKESQEVLEFFAEGITAPSYPTDHAIGVYPVEKEDMVDGHLTRGQIYNFETGKIEDTILSINLKCEHELRLTDWMVIRHRDQVDLCIDTSLSKEEYKELLERRQYLRETIV